MPPASRTRSLGLSLRLCFELDKTDERRRVQAELGTLKLSLDLDTGAREGCGGAARDVDARSTRAISRWIGGGGELTA
jgi:hypothetical protein